VIHVESGGPTSVSEHNPQQSISQLEPDGKFGVIGASWPVYTTVEKSTGHEKKGVSQL
jgi:hypothetical protein